MDKDPQELKQEIFEKVEEYFNLVHLKKQNFRPGKDSVNYGGRFYDFQEMHNLIDSSLEFWLTSGRYHRQFESKLASTLGLKHSVMVNSGSSANLLAFMTLTSHKLKERRICRGDEVITVAAGFPTTVAPVIQYGAVPVFVDISLPTYNIDCSQLEAALSQKTKAVFIAHSLGNPFDLNAVKEFCTKNNLWLIEDNCDALGSLYDGRLTGTFGDLGTSSFYPPHHITTGEGGAVYTNSGKLKIISESFRDWGRDCFCPSGTDNTCNKRFGWSLGELPHGYDHKYIYTHFGYNLKATDMQASIGVAQLDKLPDFTAARVENFNVLKNSLVDLEDYFILPEATANSQPSWFGFLLTVKDEAPFTRKDIVTFLEENKIQTRMLFAGNLTRHPCFDEFRGNENFYRVIGELHVTDKVMKDTFWVGVYPGMSEAKLMYMQEKIHQFCQRYK